MSLLCYYYFSFTAACMFPVTDTTQSPAAKAMPTDARTIACFRSGCRACASAFASCSFLQAARSGRQGRCRICFQGLDTNSRSCWPNPRKMMAFLFATTGGNVYVRTCARIRTMGCSFPVCTVRLCM